MPLRKTKGNMYGFISATWNPIKGKCQHDCSYCYMKRFPQKDLRFDVKDAGTNLGKNNFIFIGSGTDMFAPDVPTAWIEDVMFRISKHPQNRYMVQSKNTMRMLFFASMFPKGTIFCTTIESNINYPAIANNAPKIEMRMAGITMLKRQGYDIMITIEPVMDFDTLELSSMLIPLKPVQINIGADSRKTELPEPTKEKIESLIHFFELNKIKVVQKTNLKRLLK